MVDPSGCVRRSRWAVRIALALSALLGALALAPPGALAVYTSSLSGTSAVMTGDGADDFLDIQRNSVLSNNRIFEGDPLFASPDDWDTATGGTQQLGITGNLTVNAGAGFDEVNLSSSPLSAMTGTLIFNGEGDDDGLNIDNFDETVDRIIAVSSTGITGLGGGSLSYSNFEHLSFFSGQGNDTITVTGSLPGGIETHGGSGGDTLRPGAGFANGFFDGEAGADTLDLSASSNGVLVDIGQGEQFSGDLNGGNVVPPSGNTAEGFANLNLQRDTGNFDFGVDQCGIDVADITGSHLHVGAPGANDPDADGFFTLQWNGDPFCSFAGGGGQPFPAAQLAALRAGNVYVDVHTAAGEQLRAQLQFDGYNGSGPGYGLLSIEGILGSPFDDILIGNDGDNTINGGALDDVLNGTAGGDGLTGGSGSDTLSGGAGGDTLSAEGDGAIDLLRCGAGTDAATADATDTVAADCETVTRLGGPAPPVVTPPVTTFDLAAAIRKCKKKFPKGPKRKRCIKRARARAQA